MKKIYQVALLSALLLAACGGSTSSPEESLANFLNKLQDLDFEGAKAYATESTGSVLNTLESMMAMMPKDQTIPEDQKKKLTKDNIKCKTEGDKAKCVVCAEGEECSPEATAITVVKEDGKWLVKMSKDEMSKDKLNKEEMNQQIEEGLEEMGDEYNTEIDEALDSIDAVLDEAVEALDSLGKEMRNEK